MQTIRLGNEVFEGRNSIYVLEGDNGLALVDTGIPTDAVEDQLCTELGESGYELADVKTILLSHWHFDHAGLAGAIQRESGARVLIHESDAPLVTDRSAIERLQDLQIEKFREWGIPEKELQALVDLLEGHFKMAGELVAAETFADGDVIEAAGREFTVVHAPGHTDGLSAFEFETDDGLEAFVGDALLPVYTPNIGGADVRVEGPLAKYLETLRTIADRDYDRALPGHRDVIEEPAERAEEIIHHHQERAERTYEILAEHGPADAWEVSAHLFGGLEGIHVMHGPGEAFAHLDHMARHGPVNCTDGMYQLESDAERDVHWFVP